MFNVGAAACCCKEPSNFTDFCTCAGKSKLLSFWDGLKDIHSRLHSNYGHTLQDPATHALLLNMRSFLIIMHGDSLQSHNDPKKRSAKFYIFFNLINLPIYGNKSSITRRNFKRKNRMEGQRVLS